MTYTTHKIYSHTQVMQRTNAYDVTHKSQVTCLLGADPARQRRRIPRKPGGTQARRKKEKKRKKKKDKQKREQ